MVDANGTEYESDNAYPLEQVDRVATERPVNAANNDDEAAKYALPEGAGTVYHATSYSNAWADIVVDDEDKALLLAVLGQDCS